MMMSNDPFETDLTALLQDYAAPMDDDGFSTQIIKQVEKQAKLRRWLLWSAYALGGLIIGSHINRLGGYWGRIRENIVPIDFGFNAPNLNHATAQLNGVVNGPSLSLIWIASAAIGLSMILWLAKDWLDSHI